MARTGWVPRLKRIALLGALLVLAAWGGVAQAEVTLRMVNRAGIRRTDLQRAEAAVSLQANRQLRPIWNTPRVSFGAHGWRVELRAGLGPISTGPHPVHPRVIAYHRVGPSGPYIVIYTGGVPWTRVLSHEVLETLVDPTTFRHAGRLEVEVCDAVETLGYMAQGILVSDFVTPAWFGPAFARRVESKSHKRSSGGALAHRFDWLGDVLQAFQVNGGFLPTLGPQFPGQSS